MPTTLKAHSVQCSFVFQVLIYENVTYLIYFWKQNFISLNLPLLKVMGSKERLVMSGVKMFLLFMIKAVAWLKSEALLSRAFFFKYQDQC